MMLGIDNAFPESFPQICSLVLWFVGSQILPAVSVEASTKLRFSLSPEIFVNQESPLHPASKHLPPRGFR